MNDLLIHFNSVACINMVRYEVGYGWHKPRNRYKRTGPPLLFGKRNAHKRKAPARLPGLGFNFSSRLGLLACQSQPFSKPCRIGPFHFMFFFHVLHSAMSIQWIPHGLGLGSPARKGTRGLPMASQ